MSGGLYPATFASPVLLKLVPRAREDDRGYLPIVVVVFPLTLLPALSTTFKNTR